MSRDLVVSGELKYFRLHTNESFYEVIQGKKEGRSASGFLSNVLARLKDNSDIRVPIKDKSLKDIVDIVVAGCDAKIGLLQRVWNAFLRNLSHCFKRLTPKIDRIHQLAAEIQIHPDPNIPLKVSRYLAQNDAASAVLAISKIGHRDYVPKLQTEIGQYLLQKPVLSEEEMSTLVSYAKNSKYGKYESPLVRGIVERFLKFGDHFKSVLEATEHFHYNGNFDLWRQQQADALIAIANFCIRQNDCLSATEAYAKIPYDKKPLELQVKLVEWCIKEQKLDEAHEITCDMSGETANRCRHQIACAYFDLKDYKNAARSITWLSKKAIIPIYCETARKIFDACYDGKLDGPALNAAKILTKEEEVCERLLEIAKRLPNPVHAEAALDLIENEKFIAQRDQALEKLKATTAQNT